MPSISQAVRTLIETRPVVFEGLVEGIISHAGLAENLQPEIEKELGKNVQLSAIVMAIRRYNENLREKSHINNRFLFNTEIIMKTGLSDICVVKSPSCIEKLKLLYALVDYDRGDTLNVTHGNYEITIVITEKYLEQLKAILKDEKILIIEDNLVSLSVSFSDDERNTSDFLHTPGIIAEITRKFAWENINIYENISTMTELIFIIRATDSLKAYKALQNLLEKK